MGHRLGIPILELPGLRAAVRASEEEVYFAVAGPRGGRTAATERRLFVGSVVDARDVQGRWFDAVVVEFDEVMGVKVHFRGWASKWDVWMGPGDDSLAEPFTHTTRWRQLSLGDGVEMRCDFAGITLWCDFDRARGAFGRMRLGSRRRSRTSAATESRSRRRGRSMQGRRLKPRWSTPLSRAGSRPTRRRFAKWARTSRPPRARRKPPPATPAPRNSRRRSSAPSRTAS
jgi:hypothetical protein